MASVRGQLTNVQAAMLERGRAYTVVVSGDTGCVVSLNFDNRDITSYNDIDFALSGQTLTFQIQSRVSGILRVSSTSPSFRMSVF